MSQQDPSRIDLAEDRTILANERTFAGWVRTSLAFVAIALGFRALFDAMSPAWIPRAIATAFLLMAMLTIVSAERRAASVISRLEVHVVATARPMNLRLIAIIVAIGAGALIAAIWLVDFR